MPFQAKVLLDSVSPAGARLTTMEVTFPRFVLPEFNTHRMFSRNGASSRAIPVAKVIAQMQEDPVDPIHWGENQAGMVAELESDRPFDAALVWFRAKEDAIRHARRLAEIGIHKQTVNRLLEPFMWQTMIVSATGYENFFTQRCAPDAEPHLCHVACMMRDAYQGSVPAPMPLGGWHTPLIQPDEEMDPVSRRRVSVARCARVSYLTHGGVRDVLKDLELFDFLKTSGHWSPFEHIATPFFEAGTRSGNFSGWEQLRQVEERRA